jgi:hypothetical protein
VNGPIGDRNVRQSILLNLGEWSRPLVKRYRFFLKAGGSNYPILRS